MSLLDLFRQEYVRGKVVDKYSLSNGNIGLIIDDSEGVDLDEDKLSSTSLNTSGGSYNVENKQEAVDSKVGVKVFRSIPHKDVKKMIREAQEQDEKCDSNDPEVAKLYDEFGEILTPVKDPEGKSEGQLTEGVLTI